MTQQFPDVVEVVDNETLVNLSGTIFVGLLPITASSIMPPLPWAGKLVIR